MASRYQEIEELIEKVKVLKTNKENFGELYDLICIEHEYEKLKPLKNTRYRFLLGETRKKEAEYCKTAIEKGKNYEDEFNQFASDFLSDLNEGLALAKSGKE